MLEELKRTVFEANMLLPRYNLITFTWGNVSQIKDGIVAIKPSGVEYEELTQDQIVLVDLAGNKIEGDLNPSSDLHTHLEIYRNFSGALGITHTHSLWATSWAQARLPIQPLGTTHADYIYGEVPCTRLLTKDEIENNYELNTGKVIVETFKDADPKATPCVLVANHGPFCWGTSAKDSVHNAVVLEQIAEMAYISKSLRNGNMEAMQPELLNKHYYRKHGENAYYGQL